MKIYTIDNLVPILNRRAVIEAVRLALINHALGRVQSPMPGELCFDDSNGDCHIKFGHMAGSASFAVKVSTGFYDNARRGIPVNNGLTLVFDAKTGAPTTLFQDQGWLTAWRTAAATALCVNLPRRTTVARVGIIGTGLQAQLAVEWTRVLLPNADFQMLGRNQDQTRRICQKLGIVPATDVATMMSTCDTIVTTTPSDKPLFSCDNVRPGMHFVGVGADGPHKQELPVGLFTRASHIVLDDRPQCTALGDFGKAVVAGVVASDAGRILGDILQQGSLIRKPLDISVVDLTGLAAQDIAIAGLFANALEGDRADVLSAYEGASQP